VRYPTDSAGFSAWPSGSLEEANPLAVHRVRGQAEDWFVTASLGGRGLEGWEEGHP
jgi:hypothetical protein